MSLANLLAQSPMILVVIVPTVVGAVLLGIVFISGFRKSRESFWVYLAELDMSYPIKPNSRLMYHKLAHVSDAHDTAQERLELVRCELKEINGKLAVLALEIPDEEKITEVQGDIQGMLNALEQSSNVTQFRRRSA